MSDPLADIVGLLRPNTSFSKLVMASGTWSVCRSDDGLPFYCAVLEGTCNLTVAGYPPITLESGDFALIPAAYEFVTASRQPPTSGCDTEIVELSASVFRIGETGHPPEVRMLIGHCEFGSQDAGLLVSLLPEFIHVRGEPRLRVLVELLDEETRDNRPGREVILMHLLAALLIEALRSVAGPATPPGLLRGMSNAGLASSLREMHQYPGRPWTVVELAKKAALSRSTFFEQFRREVGVTPMDYLLCWRMALAKELLRQKGTGVAQVAERVGYSSASTFSTAFTRHVGTPPAQYARTASASR